MPFNVADIFARYSGDLGRLRPMCRREFARFHSSVCLCPAARLLPRSVARCSGDSFRPICVAIIFALCSGERFLPLALALIFARVSGDRSTPGEIRQ